MNFRTIFITSMLLWAASAIYALEPNEILIIANSDLPDSVKIANYYCQKRNTPKKNILALPLGASLSAAISREDYETKLASPIRAKLESAEFAGKIRCLLTTYGVPFKVGKRGPLKDQQEKLRTLEQYLEQEKEKLKQAEHDPRQSAVMKKIRTLTVAKLKSDIELINGKETDAAVDSELAMVLLGDYELYRWQPNRMKDKLQSDLKSLMVSRLDGPGPDIAMRLIDKAVAAERNGLKGKAYVDSRGIPDDHKPYSFGFYDQSLRDMAEMIRAKNKMPVVEERTEALFGQGQCPSTAIYCGWYSLKKYIDSFEFTDGAIGYHIASWEAIDLRDANSSQWCPSMLKKGITATLGAVAEPYLSAFPQPKEFFAELFDGYCLAEAYCRTNPYNSWQMMLIGDPLYTPFKKEPLAK